MADFFIQKLLLCDANIFTDGSGEKERFLEYHADILAQVLTVNVTNVCTANGNTAAVFRQII